MPVTPRASVRAMMTRSGSTPRGGRGAQLRAHFVGIDERLARQMAAALGQQLVFELDGRGAGRFELDDRPLDVHRGAEAGVGIDDQRQLDAAGDEGGLLGQLAQREQPNVGQSHHAGQRPRPKDRRRRNRRLRSSAPPRR